MSGQAGAPRARYFSKEPKESLLIRFSTAARKYWFIYLLAIPGLLFLLVFSYAPMYGVVLAFKDFKMNLGVMAAHGWGFTTTGSCSLTRRSFRPLRTRSSSTSITSSSASPSTFFWR